MPEVPLYERPGRELGSVWTQTPRACENCEQTHQALINWTDGSRLCVTCSSIRRRNLATASWSGPAVKVHVVIEDTGNAHEVDGWSLLGVYSTEEKAQAVMPEAEHPEWTTIIPVEVDS